MSVGREKAVKEKKNQLLQSELDNVIPKLRAATGDVCVELLVWQLERRHSYIGSVSLGREDCLVETESFNMGKWMPRWHHTVFCESNSRSVETSKFSGETTVFYFPGWVWLTGAYFSVVTKRRIALFAGIAARLRRIYRDCCGISDQTHRTRVADVSKETSSRIRGICY